MSGETRRTALPGSLLQRLARRLCAPITCERVLLPILADLQFEWQQAPTAAGRLLARLRSTWAFARALVPALVRDAALDLYRNPLGGNPPDREAAKRLLLRIGLATLVASAVQLGQTMPAMMRRGLADAVVLIVPAVLSVALPIGCLLGVVLAVGHGRTVRTRWRPLLGTAVLTGLVTFGIAGWLTPRANQAYRYRVYATLAPEAPARLLRPGHREWTFAELGARVAELRLAGEARAADRAAVEWHKKPALAASCVALALAGVALAGVVSPRWLQMVLSVLLIAGVNALFRLGEQLADAGWFAPALAMWGPVAAVLAVPALLNPRKRGDEGAESEAR